MEKIGKVVAPVARTSQQTIKKTVKTTFALVPRHHKTPCKIVPKTFRVETLRLGTVLYIENTTGFQQSTTNP